MNEEECGVDHREELQKLYEAYIEKAETLEKNRGIGDGLFGLGKKPADDPCHDRFAEDLEAFLTRVKSDADEEETAWILRWIYEVPEKHREPLSLYWMLLAVHGLTRGLVETLSPADAGEIAARYRKQYPRRSLLPVQKALLKDMERRSKQ